MFHPQLSGFKINSRESKSGRIIKVKVIPMASRQSVEEEEDGSYLVHVKGVPEKGRANRELLSILATHIGVSKSDLAIIRGSRSRHKIIKVK